MPVLPISHLLAPYLTVAVPSAFASRCAFAGSLNAGREPAAARDPAPLLEE
jgi:hypothetical protein